MASDTLDPRARIARSGIAVWGAATRGSRKSCELQDLWSCLRQDKKMKRHTILSRLWIHVRKHLNFQKNPHMSWWFFFFYFKKIVEVVEEHFFGVKKISKMTNFFENLENLKNLKNENRKFFKIKISEIFEIFEILKFLKIWTRYFRKFWKFSDFHFFRFCEKFSRNFCRIDF